MECQCEHFIRFKEWLRAEIASWKRISANCGLTEEGMGSLTALQVSLDFAENPERLKARNGLRLLKGKRDAKD